VADDSPSDGASREWFYNAESEIGFRRKSTTCFLEIGLRSNLPNSPYFALYFRSLKPEKMDSSARIPDWGEVLGIENAVFFDEISVYVVILERDRLCTQLRVSHISFDTAELDMGTACGDER
jgi:hypothetical protein